MKWSEWSTIDNTKYFFRYFMDENSNQQKEFHYFGISKPIYFNPNSNSKLKNQNWNVVSLGNKFNNLLELYKNMFHKTYYLENELDLAKSDIDIFLIKLEKLILFI